MSHRMNHQTLDAVGAFRELVTNAELRAEITNAIRERASALDMMRAMSCTDLAEQMNAFADAISRLGVSLDRHSAPPDGVRGKDG